MRPSTASETTLVRPARRRAAAQLGPRVRTAAKAQLTLVAADALTLTLAVAAATLGARGAGLDVSTVWAAATALAAVGAYATGGLYAPRLRRDLLDDAKVVVVQTMVGAALVLAVQALVTDVVRTDPVVRTAAFATVFVIAGRATVHSAIVALWRSGVGLRPVLIVGAGRVGRLVASRLREHPEYGLRPVGFLDKEPLESEPGSLALPVLGASWDLDDVIAEHGVQEVVIAFSRAPSDVVVRIAERCEALGVPVTVVPRVFEKTTTRLQSWHLGGLPLLSARAPNPNGFYFAVKYLSDRVAAALLVVALSPVLLAVAAAVALSLGRPVLFRQTRIGRDGRTFDILKFRTMRDARPGTSALDTLPEGLAPGGVEGDDRRTRVGALLRRTSLDELPQLLNVVKGEMSLVGPRPERPEFVARFNGRVYRYAERHRVKSGITGWAQVNGLRGKTPIADRAEWDNYYIENFSFWLDLKILLLTATSVLRMARTVE